MAFYMSSERGVYLHEKLLLTLSIGTLLVDHTYSFRMVNPDYGGNSFSL